MNSPQRHRDPEKSFRFSIFSSYIGTLKTQNLKLSALCLCASVVCLFFSSVIFTQQLKGPITAGGFVDGAPVVFSDITSKTGLDRFHHRAGTPEMKYIL